MSTYNLGRVLPIFKGLYSATETYENLDVVFYNGSSYVANGSTTGNLPTDTDYWTLVAQAGTLDETQIEAIEAEVLVWIQQQGYVVDNDYTHTDNNFTDAEKTKLQGIESGAEANVNADWNATNGDAKILNKPTIPTATSQLSNDSGFLTEHQTLKTINNQSIVGSGNITIESGASDWSDITNKPENLVQDASYVHTDNNYTTAEKNKLSGIDMSTKQNTLVSGTNIKTINNQTLLGSGNITIEGGGSGTTDYTDLSNKPSINGVELSGNKTTSELGISIPDSTSDLANDSGYITKDVNDLTNYYTKSSTRSMLETQLSTKQDTLESGTNIKTINNQSILGSGNITIEGGGSGTTDYIDLSNKPQINGNTLTGNKTTSDLGINIPTTTSDLINDSNFVNTTQLNTKQDTLVSGTNIKTINSQSLLGSGNITIEGEKGEDAVNPFKGLYSSKENIPATITSAAIEGDYVFIEDSGATTISIYKWDSSQSDWIDSGYDIDPAALAQFSTGERVDSISIDDNFANKPESGVNTIPSGDSMRALFEKVAKKAPSKMTYEGSFKTDGTFSTNYPTTYVFDIPKVDCVLFADFRIISSNLMSYLSVAYFDDAMNMVGYDASYHTYPTYNVYGVILENIPSTATKIALWSSANPAQLWYIESSSHQTALEIDAIENSMASALPYVKEESFKTITDYLVKTDGTFIHKSEVGLPQWTCAVKDFYINPANKYVFEVPSVYINYPIFSIAYYTEDYTFISGEIDGRYRNDKRTNLFSYIPTIPSNARIVRLLSDEALPEPGVYRYNNAPLYGKKIAVIGDSIATKDIYTTPFIRITPSMVGTQISTYITYYDKHDQDGTSISNTLGGVAITDAMNDGQLHQFTPVSGDIGKSFGVPKYYSNNESLLPWPYLLARLIGGEVVGNASYSASSLTSLRENLGAYETGSAAWKDYTIERCSDYDYKLREKYPDIIIIARGLNDFSRSDISGSDNLGSMDLNNIDLSDGFNPNITTDNSNGVFYFKKAYLATIQKLRSAYPKALVVCATINYANPRENINFPPRNNAHSICDFSDAIRDVANLAGCPIIEFDKDGINQYNYHSESYITDNQHPSQKGHWAMAVKAASDLRYALPSTEFNL